MTKPFRFGIQVSGPIGDLSWSDTARQIEDSGFSTVVVPDHFGDQLAPVTALAAAAAVTSTLRLGALVFANDYRHPVVLAKEIATLDVISNGRAEWGIGAGWMRADYEQAGMTMDRPGVRIDRLDEALDIIAGLFGADPVHHSDVHYRIDGLQGLPRPVQAGGPPLLIGGGGKRMLSLAAQRADIVGVTANLRAGEVGPDAVADLAPTSIDQKLTWVKDAAGDRFDDIELNCLTLTFPGDDRVEGAAAIGEMFGAPTEDVLGSPGMLTGPPESFDEVLQERRERWGFSYVVFQLDDLAAVAPTVARLTGS